MKRYIITSYIPNADIDTNFYRSINKYCKENKAQLLLMECAANKKEDLKTDLTIRIENEFGAFITGNKKINDNLNLIDYKQSVNVLDPVIGLDSIVSATTSLIIAYPRHRCKVIARMIREGGTPQMIWCCGTISKPLYKNNKSGMRAKFLHTMGALVVEVENNKIFHVRQVTWNGKGFYDLTSYYTPTSVKKNIKAAALVMGDDHVIFHDPKVVKKTKEQITLLRPEKLFRHDILDCVSISHHLNDKHITKATIKLTLKQEGIIVGNSLKEFEKEFPKTKQIVVASNHNEHLDRYLEEARYVGDPVNHILALELALDKARDLNPTEQLIKKFTNLNNVQFIERKTSYKVAGVECGDHGDEGANGSKGNTKQKGLVYNGKSITGHTHSPCIGEYGNYVVGTQTYLSLHYTKDSGASSWLNSNCVVYPDGNRTLLNIMV